MNLSFLKNKKIDQVVWLGAGDLAKADLVFNAKTTVHLVDADETIIERLTKRFKQDKNVTVHPLVISDKNNNVDFSYYSLKEFNGIAQPAALKQRYPGLKQVKSDNKKATAIIDFLVSINLKLQQKNTIIFDLPGLSSTLIQTLISNNALHQFNKLIVLASQQSLFNGELLATDLTDLLEKNGFLCEMHQSNYQDYSIVQAELNPLYIETAEIKKLLQNAKAEIKQLQARQDKEQAEKNTQIQQKQQQILLLNQQKADLTKRLEQKQADYEKREEEIKVQINNIQERKNRNDVHLTELQQKLQLSEQGLEEKNKKLTLQQQEIEQTKKRQLLLEEELIKTEAQIIIIKELLIKDSSQV